MMMEQKITYKINTGWGSILFLILFLMAHSCSLNDEWDEHYQDTPGRIDENILQLIADEPGYSRFYENLLKYGYDDLLTKNQFFTIFVPVNEAFEGLPQYSDEEWQKILDFHIVYASLFSQDFEDRNLLSTAGKYLNLADSGSNEYFISGAKINMAHVDKACQNGVIHEIEDLLVPKPNVYEYIMNLDSSYSILRDFISSMDKRFIDYERSERIGVDNDGNTIYDTVWREENYFLDNIAELDSEEKAFTGFIPSNEDVRRALEEVSGYFGNIGELNEETYNQLLFITFSGSFTRNAYNSEDLPDTLFSVSGKTIATASHSYKQTNLSLSNGIVHLLSDMIIPKSYFVVPIIIECDRKENRTVSNTMYPIEQMSDTRASNGSYVFYDCRFVGDYIEFTVDMVLKTTYWFVWTGPKQGPSHYQLFVKDEISGEFVNVGGPVNNWTKGNFIPVVAGTHTFNEFGSKTVRMIIVDELPLIGYNSIYLDYIKLIPDEIYGK